MPLSCAAAHSHPLRSRFLWLMTLSPSLSFPLTPFPGTLLSFPSIQNKQTKKLCTLLKRVRGVKSGSGVGAERIPGAQVPSRAPRPEMHLPRRCPGSPGAGLARGPQERERRWLRPRGSPRARVPRGPDAVAPRWLRSSGPLWARRRSRYLVHAN